jgi:hypothetical protein
MTIKPADKAAIALPGGGALPGEIGTWRDPSRGWMKAGAACWLLACAVVVARSYASGEPVRTRGGFVRREHGRLAYALTFIPFVVIGRVAAIVLATA